MGALVYVGTYTDKGAEGIYSFHYDDRRGKLGSAGVARNQVDPSFLALHPSGSHLYAVNERIPDEEGTVSAFRIDAAGGLSFLGSLSTGGRHPCHVAIDRGAGMLVVSNYSSGSVAVFRLAIDGSLAERTQLIRHQGASVDPRRQSGPHAHSATFDPSGRFCHVCDLGTDRVVRYRVDAAAARLEPEEPAAALSPGSGPRHFAFSPDGRFAYAINELASTITVFAYQAAEGRLRQAQTISTLPKGWTGRSTCADLHVHPSGRFLYGSNRGHDSIAVFRVDPAGGSLTAAGHVSTGGRTPRGFALDPAGRFLLAANQDGASIVTFAIDQATGTLAPTGTVASVPGPVCLRFLVKGGS